MRRICQLICSMLSAVLVACAAATPQTSAPAPSMPAITISAPQPDAAVASPLELRGRVSYDLAASTLIYRVFDRAGHMAGSGPLSLDANGAFAATVAYTSTNGGPGRIEVIALRADNDTPFAINAVSVRMAAVAPPDSVPAAATAPAPTVAPLVTAVPASDAPDSTQQTLVIDSPAPGTLVGSPLVLTGHTSAMPPNGALGYRVLDAQGQQSGSGSLAVAPAAAGGGTFNASLLFDTPDGGTIRVELFEQRGDNIIASTSRLLAVAAPQRIVIDSPAPSTLVGSPLVLAGFTTQAPFAGSLAFRVLDETNRELGTGRFDLQSASSQPSHFTASLPFDLPPDGGAIAVELLDQNPDNGTIAASAAISLQVAAPRQVIVIDTPAPGTQVGSPVVLTGRAALVSAGGQLSYRVRAASGRLLGSGMLPVRNAGPVAAFTASLTFDEPPSGGPISIDLLDQGDGGTLVARGSIDLVVAAR